MILPRINYHRWLKFVLRTVVATVVGLGLALWWCGRGAGAVLRRDLAIQQSMTAGVARWLAADMETKAYATGKELFDGEWLFGTYVMSGLGLVQATLEHPELRATHVPLVRMAVERLISPEVRNFDKKQWHEDALESLDGGLYDHAAYLGYTNLLLAAQALIDPQSPTRDLHERISRALEARLQKNRIGLLLTYPGECYPVDNAAVISSLALRERRRDGAIGPFVRILLDNYKSRWLDPANGLLIQAVSWESGKQTDHARGSGTSLAAYFLSFADAEIAASLHQATVGTLAQSGLGLTAVREYRPGVNGRGDIDSGPLIAGLSVSATGFSLAGCLQAGDEAGFTARWRLVHLLGVPAEKGGEFHYIMGGRLGDAILFAMCTALTPETLAHAIAKPPSQP